MGVIVEERRAAAAPGPMVRVLLVESNEVQRLTHLRLLKHSRCAFSISAVDTPQAALLSVRARPYDVILLDIDADEPSATMVIEELALAAPGTAILVLASRADYSMATLACELGAQDYLVKEELDQTVLERAIRCAIGRKRREAHLTGWAYMDALTGLVNRRLFCDRLTHALARATRADKGAALLFIDLDNFKQINDRHGHAEGDAALRAAAVREQRRGARCRNERRGRAGPRRTEAVVHTRCPRCC